MTQEIEKEINDAFLYAKESEALPMEKILNMAFFREE